MESGGFDLVMKASIETTRGEKVDLILLPRSSSFRARTEIILALRAVLPNSRCMENMGK
jgi:hypothetical protein